MRIIRFIALSVVVMFSAGSYAQTTYKTVKHAPAYPSGQEMGNIKTAIAGILQKDTKIVDKASKKWGNPKDVMVLDDRIEFSIKNQKMIINFSDLLEYDIETGETMMSENNGPFNLIYYEMELWNCTIYFRMKSEPAYLLASDLFFIQQRIRKDNFSSQLVLFKPIAEKYRSLKEKPAISEELRKFIVQANAFNQKKQYSDAIYAYSNAIKSDPVSYPAAYSNLALLSAQISKYDAAIFYMKEYLLLVPDATDARSAQDKIYEWESMITE